MPTTHFLAPPLFEQGCANEFIESGRILAATFSPRDDSLAVFARPNVRNIIILLIGVAEDGIVKGRSTILENGVLRRSTNILCCISNCAYGGTENSK